MSEAEKLALLIRAAKECVAAERLSPGDCYDAQGNPNENWGRTTRARAALERAIAIAETK